MSWRPLHFTGTYDIPLWDFIQLTLRTFFCTLISIHYPLNPLIISHNLTFLPVPSAPQSLNLRPTKKKTTQPHKITRTNEARESFEEWPSRDLGGGTPAAAAGKGPGVAEIELSPLHVHKPRVAGQRGQRTPQACGLCREPTDRGIVANDHPAGRRRCRRRRCHLLRVKTIRLVGYEPPRKLISHDLEGWCRCCCSGREVSDETLRDWIDGGWRYCECGDQVDVCNEEAEATCEAWLVAVYYRCDWFKAEPYTKNSFL